MLVKRNTLFSLIINAWFIFNLFLIVISNFPHWPIPTTSWLNHSLYFLLFLLTTTVAIKEKNAREIFILLSILFLLFAAGIFHSFTGNNYLFGDDYFVYYLLTYKKVGFSFLVLLIITQILLRYIQKGQSKYFVLGQSLLVSAVVTYILFRNFLLDRNYLLYENVGLKSLYFHVLIINVILFLLIGVYCFLRYRLKRPNGETLGLFIAAFFLYVVIEIGDSYLSFLGKKNFNVSQLVLIVNLLIFVVVMLRKLIHLYSPFGNYYERLILAKLNLMNVPATGVHEANRSLMTTTAKYILRMNYVSPIKLFFISLIPNMLYLPLYMKITIFMILFCMATFIAFYQALYRSRIRHRGYLQ
ncbi:MAG: hypothetical protein ACOY90_00490 [Candidatus Zhuqueibacterota bacterium]